MASITDEEKRFIKGVFIHYNGEYTGQEILGIVNNKRGNPANHINIGRVTEVKGNDSIIPMTKDEVDEWIKKYSWF